MKSKLTAIFAVLALTGLLAACADMGSSSGSSSSGGQGGGHSHFTGSSN